MSQPREILPYSTYHVIRRVHSRQMLLRPDKRMTQILFYLLAVIAQRHGIAVHAACAMSDHLHLVVTDINATLPRFLQSFHRMVALCTMALRKRADAVWDKRPTTVIHLKTPTAMIETIAYVLANPVSAGLVQHAHEWPGLKVLADDIGQGSITADRPDVYLDPANPNWPPTASYPIALPPGVEDAETFRQQVTAELRCLEAEAHSKLATEKRLFLGASRATQVNPASFATSTKLPNQLTPKVAVGRHQKEALKHAIGAMQAFRALYREALTQWRKKCRDILFPPGTWWMRVFHDAKVGSGNTVSATSLAAH